MFDVFIFINLYLNYRRIYPSYNRRIKYFEAVACQMDVMCCIYHITASLTSSGPRSSSLTAFPAKIWLPTTLQLCTIKINICHYFINFAQYPRLREGGGFKFWRIVIWLVFLVLNADNGCVLGLVVDVAHHWWMGYKMLNSSSPLSIIILYS